MTILHFTRTDGTATDISQEGFPEPTYDLRNAYDCNDEQFNVDGLSQKGLVEKIIEAANSFGKIKIYRGNGNTHNAPNNPYIDCNTDWYKFEGHLTEPSTKEEAEGFNVGVTIHGATGDGDDLLKIGRAVYSETNF